VKNNLPAACAAGAQMRALTTMRLALSMVSLLAASAMPAQAQTVNLTFKGVYTLETCTINDQSITIDFGATNENSFSGNDGPTKPITIAASCPAGWPVRYTLAATADTDNPSAIKNSAVSGATGFGILIRSSDLGTTIVPNASLSNHLFLQDGLQATLVRTKAAGTEGAISASATLTANYD